VSVRSTLTGAATGADRGALLASAAHLALIVGFFLPWLDGPFGARGSLSGLDVVRVAETLAEAYPEARIAANALATVAAAVPGLAVAALALIWVTPHLGWRRRRSAVLATWVAVVLGTGVVALSILVGYAQHSSDLIDAPGSGLLVMSAALPAALAALLLRD
jgi:hypothetical protein